MHLMAQFGDQLPGERDDRAKRLSGHVSSIDATLRSRQNRANVVVRNSDRSPKSLHGRWSHDSATQASALFV